MGDSISTCCSQPTENQLPPREVISQDSSQYQHRLEQFFNKFPKIKQLNDRKWTYCHNVDKNAIAINANATFVGGIPPRGQSKEMIVMYESGFFYEGEIVDELRQGLGRLISYEGDCYEGKWDKDQPDGEGTYQGANPHRKYTGIWSKGELLGKAKITYEDGSFYQGQFYQNMRQGKGKITYADGTIYQGDFKNNVIEGFGVLIGINHKYEGSWKDGKMDGAGKSYWYGQNDELLETYQGQYVAGVKHGKGEYRWSTGRVYRGEWQNGDIKREKESYRIA